MRSAVQSRPALQFSFHIPSCSNIVQTNYLQTAARLSTEILIKSAPQLPSNPYIFALSKEEKRDTLSLPFAERVEPYDLCKMLYNKSRSGYDISILSSQNEWLPVFTNSKEKDQFQEVMRDYFRLTKQI